MLANTTIWCKRLDRYYQAKVRRVRKIAHLFPSPNHLDSYIIVLTVGVLGELGDLETDMVAHV